jgi:site-specific DNA-cytosine methylase
VQRDSQKGRASREGATADAADGAGAGQWWDGSDCAATLTKQNANGMQRMPDKDNLGAVLQPIVIDRAAFNQGENAQYDPVIREDDAMPSMVARGPHAVAVPFRKSKRAQSTTDDESWVEAEQANTLNAFDTGERDTHAVAFKPGQSAAARSIGAQEEVACTLEGGGGGNNRQAVAFSPGNLKRGAGAGPNEEVFPTLKCSAGRGADDQRPCVAIGTDMYNHAITGDVAATMGTPGSSVNASGPTVMQAHGFYSTDGSHGVNQQPEVSPAVKVGSGLGIPSPPAVAHALRGEGFDASEDGTGRGTPIIPVAHAIGFIPKAPPNSRSMGEEVENGPTVTTHMMGQGVSLSLPMTVRRLTPRECERLQAFPDDYTLIPWRKKPADQCPDGPRYKALGNSMAVNCMEWIGERIAAYEAKERKP